MTAPTHSKSSPRTLRAMRRASKRAYSWRPSSMAALPEILLLVGSEKRPGEMVRSSGVAPAKLRILSWDRVRGEDFERRDLRAVVFEPNDSAVDRRRRQALLRQVPQGVAKVSLAGRAGRAEARRRDTATDLQLAPPVDLRVLTSLLNLGRRVRTLED